MKKVTFYLTILGLLLYSCTVENEDILAEKKIDTIKQETVYLSQIDTATVVDTKKAIHVAQLFQKQQKLTRSTSYERVIKGVETLADNDDRPLLYIINYANNQGFVLVSASQDYSPILAFSDKGNFYLEDVDKTGISIWLDNQKKIIKSAATLPDSTKQRYRKLWIEYNTTNKELTTTRSNDDVYNLIYSSINKWKQDGYNVFRYADIKDTPFFQELPSNFIIAVRQAADSADPRYGGRNNNTFILIKQNDNYQSVKPLIQTHWSQFSGYNQYTPNNYPVGCVAVAMGQIMKYYEYPQRYSWSLMANDYATSATAAFLHEIGQKVGMDYKADGSSSNIDKALSAFKNYYGYSSAQKISHSLQKVITELQANRPVYMRGVDSSDGGHAWVCDGYYSTNVCNEYILYILEDTYDGTEPTEMSYIYSENGSLLASSLAFHMNWGWNNNDGYFTNDNVSISNMNYNFSKDRKDIIGLCPDN